MRFAIGVVGVFVSFLAVALAVGLVISALFPTPGLDPLAAARSYGLGVVHFEPPLRAQIELLVALVAGTVAAGLAALWLMPNNPYILVAATFIPMGCALMIPVVTLGAQYLYEWLPWFFIGPALAIALSTARVFRGRVT